MGSDVLDQRLRSIAGVGAWTSAEVRRVALGDADAVSVGDYHLPNMVAWTLPPGGVTLAAASSRGWVVRGAVRANTSGRGTGPQWTSTCAGMGGGTWVVPAPPTLGFA